MCGIVGYAGDGEAARILLQGLKRLEYRGYDSAGLAIVRDGQINVQKSVGKLEVLEELQKKEPLGGNVGIGHTRWATHGKPSTPNAHPHTGCTARFVVVHNGIIENFSKLRQELIEKGHSFQSETDTEVIPHLLEEYYRGDMKEALLKLMDKIEGSYALAILCREEPDRIWVVRKDSPLVIGLGEEENLIASDIPALLDHTKRTLLLDDGEIAVISKEEVIIYSQNGDRVEKEVFEVPWDVEMAEKGGYEHFMLKEIHEQPEAIRHALRSRIDGGLVDLTGDSINPDLFKGVERIAIVACGTAYHSGLAARYYLQRMLNLPVTAELASEFRYNEPIIDENTLVIVVSQSGETADTLAALRLARVRGARVLALVNVVGSTISREADHVLYIHAGPEIAVASTKAFTNMLICFYLLGIYWARILGTMSSKKLQEITRNLERLPELAAETLGENEGIIRQMARDYAQKANAFFIGRGIDYTLAMEGALKLKEISYIHAEAYAAGELKHGTLALIEDGVPVVALASQNILFDKMLSNIKEVKAREANVLAVAQRGSDHLEDLKNSVDSLLLIPRVDEILAAPLVIIPLQLLAYYIAVERGCDVDQPRNLAKSVTVE